MIGLANRLIMSSGGVRPVTYEVLTTYANLGSGGSHTITATSFGTVASDRVVVCVVLSAEANDNGANSLITAMTIGGSTANFATSFASDNGDSARVTFAYLAVPTGTTGDIVINFASRSEATMVQVYSLYGLINTGPQAQDSSGGVAGATLTDTVAVEEGGLVLAAAAGNGRLDTMSATWGSAVTADTGTGVGIGSFASKDGLSADPTYSVAITGTGSHTWFSHLVTAWR